jgi:hypothetical protein
VYTLPTQVAFKGSFIVRMCEDHVLWTGFHALQTGCALIALYVVSTLVVLKNALHRTHFGTLAALGASAHLEYTRIGEPRHYGQARLLGVVLLEMIEGAGQLAKPAPGTFGAIGL